jgi:hypothetical protein
VPHQKPVAEGVSIVALGSFNPAIFQPQWFARNGLIDDGEAEKAKVEVIHPEVAAFAAEWFSLQVLRERLTVQTEDPSAFPLVGDLVANVFTLLIHTPVTAVGLNREAHFKLGSEEEWHSLGHRLAPPEYWEDFLKQPGMLDLTMQGQRPDDHKGFVRALVQPSARPDAHPGVFLSRNDHFQVAEEGDEEGATLALAVVGKHWTSSLSAFDTFADSILGLT